MSLTKWSFEKGIYNPPPLSIYPKLIRRTINITKSIDEKIGIIIGKNGENFIDLTEKYNLLYIFYTDYKIELYGLDDTNIMSAIHEIIKKIKYLNYLIRQKESI